MLLSLLLWACDPEGKKNCAWILEPETTQTNIGMDDYVPVCARNRVTMKQDCRLKVKLSYAKEHEGKTFRYVDMVVASPALPRVINSITFCKE